MLLAPIMGVISTYLEGIISISKLTDILTILLFSIVVWTAVFLFLRDNPYYLILAFVLSVIADALYIFLKIRSKPPPPKDTGHNP